MPRAPRIELCTGYRTTDYPDFKAIDTPFVYLNIGMFARLSSGVAPGEIFAVHSTLVIDSNSSSSRPTICAALNHLGEDDALSLLPHCRLLSVPDAFPFVTPDAYDQRTVMALFAAAEFSDSAKEAEEAGAAAAVAAASS
jgi:hypothetical protein